MTFWTWPALRVEIEYRQEQVRRDAAGWRRARRRAGEDARIDEQHIVTDPRDDIPAQREACPGEQRMPVGCASGPNRR